jgi:ABC-type lipoprotein export system ATPase subunit
MATEAMILCDNLVKIYKVADLEVVALQGLDLEVPRGEMMALVGASGSGKSTLLNVIGGLDTPSAGGIWVDGRDLLKISERDRVDYKREVVGFVWQQPARNLLPYLSARENVELPMMLARGNGRQRRQRALELLEMVGLADRAEFRPDRLSGGQQQRVALAIALANNPPLLLADEPTGQVDSAAAAHIFDALRRINETFGTTVIVVTHDQRVANKVDRVVAIRDGRTSTEIRRDRNLHDGSVNEEEWVILDRAGRLQLPQPYIENLALRERVKLRLEEDHVSVWPGVERMGEEAPAETNGTVWRPPRLGYGRLDEAPEPATARQLEAAVAVENLTRVYQLGSEEVHAVENVSLTIPAAALVVVKGPSGSGKTTLLNLIAGLDEPTSGTVTINGKPVSGMSNQEKIELRRREIGFVFQTFGLLPFLSARENIEAPLRLVRASARERTQRVNEVLELVGLTGRSNHRTYELSGGEQQRVALARALANRPSLILADEPTGQLDTATGYHIIALLREIVEKTGVTAVIASHDPKVEEAADRVYVLEDGRLVETRGQGIETAVVGRA